MHEHQGTIQQTLSKQEKFQERAQIPRFQGQNKTEGGNLLMSRTPFIRHVGQGLQLCFCWGRSLSHCYPVQGLKRKAADGDIMEY